MKKRGIFIIILVFILALVGVFTGVTINRMETQSVFNSLSFNTQNIVKNA